MWMDGWMVRNGFALLPRKRYTRWEGEMVRSTDYESMKNGARNNNNIKADLRFRRFEVWRSSLVSCSMHPVNGSSPSILFE